MAAQRKKVLLVDDSQTVLMMQKTILRTEDVEIVVAHDGQEGVERAFNEKPDLILMDVIMPRLDGFEACRKIRSNRATQKTPIIIVTTRSEAKNVQNGFDAGCNDYITKPIDAADLLAKVRKFLGAA